MENKKILIASDHAGFHQKEFLKARLIAANYDVQDEGCHSPESVHYPEYAALLAGKIKEGFPGLGVLICGSGQGMMMAANRFSGVRAGLAWNEEIARLMRSHNDARIICFGARFTADEYAWQMLKVFLDTPFDGGKHAIRTGLMDDLA
jgi:ribose 5-phosphate isomerase B